MSLEQTKKPKDISWYINVCITLVIMIGFQFLPAPEPISQLGWATIGILLGCIYGWLTTSYVWVGIAALCVFGLVSGKGPSAAWGIMMSNQNVTLAIWLMVSCALITDSGCSRWIAQWSVSRKFTAGKPWALWFMVMLADILVGAILGQVGAIIVFFALLGGILKELGIEKGSATGAFWFMSVVVFAVTSSIIMPFHLAVVMNFGMLAAGSGGVFDGSFSYINYMGFSLTINAIELLIYYVVFRYIVKVDMSKVAEFDPSKRTLEPLGKAEKICFGLFIIMFVLIMVPSAVPSDWEIAKFLNLAGTTGIIMILLAFACFYKVDGKPIVNFEKAFANNVFWGPVFLFGVSLTLAATINAKDNGVQAFVSQNLGAFLTSLDPMVFFVCFMLLALVLTNCINNATVGAIMMPMSWSLAVAVGINPLVVCACFIIFCDYAILLPSASPSAALLYSNGGWVSRSQIFKYGSIALGILFVVSLAVGFPLANIAFAGAVPGF